MPTEGFNSIFLWSAEGKPAGGLDCFDRKLKKPTLDVRKMTAKRHMQMPLY